jgi:hypothetical protein
MKEPTCLPLGLNSSRLLHLTILSVLLIAVTGSNSNSNWKFSEILSEDYYTKNNANEWTIESKVKPKLQALTTEQQNAIDYGYIVINGFDANKLWKNSSGCFDRMTNLTMV